MDYCYCGMEVTDGSQYCSDYCKEINEGKWSICTQCGVTVIHEDEEICEDCLEERIAAEDFRSMGR